MPRVCETRDLGRLVTLEVAAREAEPDARADAEERLTEALEHTERAEPQLERDVATQTSRRHEHQSPARKKHCSPRSSIMFITT